jgi:hypothetical protein
MVFQFKINPDSTKNEWVGWFGENIIKVKINASKDKMFETFLLFLETDLGIQKSNFTILEQNIQKRLIRLELPDVSWELFLSIIEK